MATQLSFKDLNITFKKHPVTNDVVVSKDASAVKQAIANILMTNKGEKLMMPDFGGDIRRYLFEPLDYGTSQQIVGGIQTAIEKYEPRIGIRALSAKPNRDDNGYDVEMTYVIRGTDQPPVAVEFFLERTR